MTVRWDEAVEPDRSRFGIWSGTALHAAAHPAHCADAATCAEIWLFGSLADAVPERPLRLQFRNPFSIDDVIAEVGRHCGDGFLSRVTAPNGSLLRHCRVFVNGEPVEDPGAPVCTQRSSNQIEMILLTAAEGG